MTAACQGDPRVAVDLDVPEGALAPAGYTSIEVRFRNGDSERVRTAPVLDGAFDLGDIAPARDVLLEAKLRSATGGVVAYGRHPGRVDLRAGEAIALPVRRPLLYLGTSRRVDDGNPYTVDPLRVDDAAYVDLSAGGTPVDARARLTSTAGQLVAAGGELYGLEQAIDPQSGRGVGAITVRSIAAGDHAVSAPLAIALELTGAVNDARGREDGDQLAVATQDALYGVRPAAARAELLATGAFARPVYVGDTLYAIKDRAMTGACNPAAQLVQLDPGAAEPTVLAATGFRDLASDGQRALALDCAGGLFEITSAGLRALRSDLVGATAVVASGGQVWIASQRGGTVSLASFAQGADEAPRPIWSQRVTQTMTATRYPGVVRTLTPNMVIIDELELGSGGEFLAAIVLSTYDEPSVPAANFPRFIIESDELWVLDASTGAVALRYRSWCNGVYLVSGGQISEWQCARESGQQAASDDAEHRLRSMAFPFGMR